MAAKKPALPPVGTVAERTLYLSETGEVVESIPAGSYGTVLVAEGHEVTEAHLRAMTGQ